MPRQTVFSLCRAVIRRFFDHDGVQSASSIAFSAVLAILPFLVMVVSLGTLIPTADIEIEIADRLFDLFPLDVARTLKAAVDELLTTPSAGLFSLSSVITLWICSSSLEAVRSAFNLAFGVLQPQRWWVRRLQSTVIVLVGAGGLLGLAFLLYAGVLAEAWVGGEADGAKGPAGEWGGMRPVVLAIGAFAFVALLFRALPRVRAAWPHLLLGSAVVVALWAGSGIVLSRYIATVSEVNPIYAIMGGIIGTMIFFYFFAVALVLGVELVAELDARAKLGDGDLQA